MTRQPSGAAGEAVNYIDEADRSNGRPLLPGLAEEKHLEIPDGSGRTNGIPLQPFAADGNWLLGAKLLEALEGIVPTIPSTALRTSVKMFLQMLLSYATIPETHQGPWVMGSARYERGSPEYETVRLLTKILTLSTFARWKLISGGGPGLMDAASRGAGEAGGEVVGCPVKLESWQTPTDATYSFMFDNLSPRKIRMTQLANAIFCYPGGFGTLDELFETLVLLQHGKTHHVSVYCIGSDGMKKLLKVIMATFLRWRTIAVEDLELFTVVDLRRQEIPKKRQRVCVLGRKEKLPWIDGRPCFRQIGLMQFLAKATHDLNSQNPDFRGSPEQMEVINKALQLVGTIQVPEMW